MSHAAIRYRNAAVGGCLEATVQRRADGSTVLRSTEALRWFPERLSDCLAQWAAEAPERTFVARRHQGGDWLRISYRQMLERAQSVGEALLHRGCSVDRPVAILSENSLEHLTLAMGALWAGVPYVPVSTAYALIAQDFGKLQHIVDTVTPGLVFAASPAYERAITAVLPAGTPVVLAEGRLSARGSEPFSALLAAQPGPALAAAHAAVGPDSIAKFLFTSGSTKAPKGVVNTHRMLCANQQMLRQTMAFLGEPTEDGGPVLVDWLPWNHTFGGNHNVGLTLYNGGTLYIDDGKPTLGGIAETLRNLREISPTVYFNVPKGFEEIARAMDTDPLLRASLFRRCQAFMFAGAGLSQAVWNQLDAHGEAAVGERIMMLTGLGMTETAPSCTFAVGPQVRSGHIGLPVPGVEVKLVNDASTGGKTEVRFRGPNVMPGYWRAPEQTAQAFDDEGFYKTGDAVAWVDEGDPQRGLRFDGRIAEDFKLATGTFVSVGPLRARIILAGDPCVQDAVITGLNRDEVGALIVPRPDDCRALSGLPDHAPLPEVLHHPVVRAFFQRLLDRLFAQATGSASRVARLHVLAEPPSIDHGEVTDKGSINQRAVLHHRAALVEALYEGREADPFLYLPRAD
jgi:feruloyl-CoA synthase